VILSQAPVVNQKVVRPLETVTWVSSRQFLRIGRFERQFDCPAKPELAAVTILLTVAAIASKLLCCFAAGRLSGLGKWNHWRSASALTQRFDRIDLSDAGTFSEYHHDRSVRDDHFRFACRHRARSFPDEVGSWEGRNKRCGKERMAKEDRCARTILPSIRRVLWPTSGKGRNRFIAKLLDSIGRKQVIETTLLWAHANGKGVEKPFANIDAVIDHNTSACSQNSQIRQSHEGYNGRSSSGYDLVVMATDKPDADATRVFGNLVDDVILHTSSRCSWYMSRRHQESAR